MLPLLDGALAVDRPAGTFFLWAAAPDADELAFTRRLWTEAGVEVLPGTFLARPDSLAGDNPGAGRVRLALVGPGLTFSWLVRPPEATVRQWIEGEPMPAKAPPCPAEIPGSELPPRAFPRQRPT